MKRSRTNLIVTMLFAAVLSGCRAIDAEGETKLAYRNSRPQISDEWKSLTLRPRDIEITQQPYLRGKAVAFSSVSGGEWSYYDVDGLTSFTAARPEDVGTVVTLECELVQKGTYTTVEEPPRVLLAFATDCDLTLIDRQLEAIIYVKRFQGTPSEEVRIDGIESSVTTGPSKVIDPFLANLPKIN